MNIQMIFGNKITTYDTKADGDAWFTRSELKVINATSDGELCAVLCLWNRLRYIDQKTDDKNKDPRNDAQPDKGSPEGTDNNPQNDDRYDEGFPETIVTLKVAEPINTIFEFCEEWSRQKGLLRFDLNGETFFQAQIN